MKFNFGKNILERTFYAGTNRTKTGKSGRCGTFWFANGERGNEEGPSLPSFPTKMERILSLICEMIEKQR